MSGKISAELEAEFKVEKEVNVIVEFEDRLTTDEVLKFSLTLDGVLASVLAEGDDSVSVIITQETALKLAELPFVKKLTVNQPVYLIW